MVVRFCVTVYIHIHLFFCWAWYRSFSNWLLKSGDWSSSCPSKCTSQPQRKKRKKKWDLQKNTRSDSVETKIRLRSWLPRFFLVGSSSWCRFVWLKKKYGSLSYGKYPVVKSREPPPLRISHTGLSQHSDSPRVFPWHKIRSRPTFHWFPLESPYLNWEDFCWFGFSWRFLPQNLAGTKFLIGFQMKQ